MGYYLWPWNAAIWIFSAEADFDGPIATLSWYRSVIGLLSIIVLELPYVDPLHVLNDAYASMVNSVPVLLVITLICSALVVLISKPENRVQMRPGMKRFALALAVCCGLWVFISTNLQNVGGLILLIAIAWLWLIPFIAVGVVVGTRAMFSSSAIHPMIPAIATIMSACYFVLVAINSNKSAPVPHSISKEISLFGFGTTMILALIELLVLFREKRRLL